MLRKKIVTVIFIEVFTYFNKNYFDYLFTLITQKK